MVITARCSNAGRNLQSCKFLPRGIAQRDRMCSSAARTLNSCKTPQPFGPEPAPPGYISNFGPQPAPPGYISNFGPQPAPPGYIGPQPAQPAAPPRRRPGGDLVGRPPRRQRIDDPDPFRYPLRNRRPGGDLVGRPPRRQRIDDDPDGPFRYPLRNRRRLRPDELQELPPPTRRRIEEQQRQEQRQSLDDMREYYREITEDFLEGENILTNFGTEIARRARLIEQLEEQFAALEVFAPHPGRNVLGIPYRPDGSIDEVQIEEDMVRIREADVLQNRLLGEYQNQATEIARREGFQRIRNLVTPPPGMVWVRDDTGFKLIDQRYSSGAAAA